MVKAKKTTKNSKKKQTKSSETDQLINSLVDNSCAVKPFRSCGFWTGIWVVAVFFALFIGILLVGTRRDFDMVLHNPLLLTQVILLFIAGASAALATFRLASPQEKVAPMTWGLIALPSAITVGLILHCCYQTTMPELQHFMNWDMVWKRIKNFIYMAIIPIALMIYMIRRAAPVHTALIGYTSFLAVGTLAVAGCRFTCSIDSMAGNLLWHFLPIVTLSLIGYVIGRFIYRW